MKKFPRMISTIWAIFKSIHNQQKRTETKSVLFCLSFRLFIDISQSIIYLRLFFSLNVSHLLLSIIKGGFLKMDFFFFTQNT